MIAVDDIDRWARFVHTPVATLVEYGLTERAVTRIEDNFGVYIASLQYVGRSEIMAIPEFGEVSYRALCLAMSRYWKSCGE